MLEKKEHHVTVRMRMLQNLDDAHEDLRALDKMDLVDKNGTDTYILLDLSQEKHYHSIMRQVSVTVTVFHFH